MVTLNRMHAISSTVSAEHQDLQQLILQLMDANTSCSDKNDIVKLMGQFIRKTHLHFIYEETLFEKHAYPDADPHKDDHRCFIQQLDGIYLSYLACKISSPIYIAEQLSDLIEAHYHRFDDDFNHFIAEKVNTTEYAIEL